MGNKSFRSIIKTIGKYKKVLIVNVAIALALGIMVSFSMPATYESSSSLASESKDEAQLGNMGSLASLAGVNLSGCHCARALSECGCDQ